ncbi:hypothetical protein DSO57_1025660 [Entomophthora muscae]|uniref:Uncharacterized protein n=1 Tax=Entomophthora muscae TaxID=34485 RepID=A0ACC2TPB2_9FUNG|nr:hypothetical protein DSO57_1025660 [Entomophthora muscae]
MLLLLVSCVFGSGVRELKQGGNPVGGEYAIGAGCRWTGAPSNFTSVHRLGGRHHFDRTDFVVRNHSMYYAVLKNSFWVEREEVDVAIRFSRKTNFSTHLRHAIPSRPSLGISEVNSFDPSPLFWSEEVAYAGERCKDGDLEMEHNVLLKHTFWIYRIYLKTTIEFVSYPSSDKRHVQRRVVHVPIRLENGRCDIFYDTLFGFGGCQASP